MRDLNYPAEKSGEYRRVYQLLNLHRNYAAELLAHTRSRPDVVAYGCGMVFQNLVPTWDRMVGKPFRYCCDADPEKWGRTYMGCPCIPPGDLLNLLGTASVFVTMGNFEPALAFLSHLGFETSPVVFKYDIVSSPFLSDTRLDREQLADTLASVRELLADGRSREVFDAILHRVLDRSASPACMSNVCDPDQYFPPDIIRLHPCESFVDAGAFTGDTLADFVRRTGGSFASIHGFEMDPDNFQHLQQSISETKNSGRIFLSSSGLWSSCAEVAFRRGACQSEIGPGESLARVVALDDVLNGERVTFLKMDIEGAELAALQGARKTILANKPKLAICVYHHFKDLWEIPLYLKSLVPEYRIFLRHHSRLEYETVCYAVPPEEITP